jgi:osmoprotectant transport system permease protein
MSVAAAPAGEVARRERERMGGPAWWRYVGRHLVMPLIVVVAMVVLYVWVSGHPLDAIEKRTLNAEFIRTRTLQTLQIAVYATAIALAIGVVLGIILTRPFTRVLAPVAFGLANLGQATPAVGLLILMTFIWGIGFKVALIGLVVYSVLPILRNTVVSISQTDPALLEAARGIGLSNAAILLRVELPLAVPVILAGIRTALVLNVGTAILATFVNAGGLGDIIVNGIALNRQPVLITGAAVTAALALTVDWVAGLIEEVLRPRGL